jgi:O-acetyl-ADP-ribose deacetylase (regulator of RNase III)
MTTRAWISPALLVVALGAAVLALVAAGCGVYTASSGRVEESRKRVFVEFLENDTTIANIGVELTDAIVDALQRDNTLKVVGEDVAASVISGRVTRYLLREMATRPDLTVNEYQVQIAVVLTFKVRGAETAIFEKKTFTGSDNYVLNDPQGTSETTARVEAAKQIVGDILALVVEDW